ncbi:hypothetical protein HGRIS_010651 [Hohenbuehelia grisea]|uniref:Protein CPL1-like domain-containing protein n=1 Tax=Hohenbuehelia grisea TaxID=104357 RepID=A0ABR3IY33_9AGAR
MLRYLLSTLIPFTCGAAPPQPGESTLEKRRPVDVCAFLDRTDPELGQLQSCFCLSGVNAFVEFRLAGQLPRVRRQAKQRLRMDIYIQGQICEYPRFANALCVSGAPCFFTCARGYTANQDARTCECTARGRIDCNNRCQLGTACVSGVAIRREEARKREVGHGCPRGQEMCGVRSERGKEAAGWECLDVRTSLESCGGCMYSFDNAPATGRDCSAIQEVNSVSCVAGACQVQSCRLGYRVSGDGSNCTEVGAAGAGFYKQVLQYS